MGRTRLVHVPVDVDNENLENAYDLKVVCKRDLDIDTGRLVQVFCGVMLFGTEDRADLIDLLAACRHHHLLIELGALVEEGLLVEVRYGKKLGPALGSCCNDLWRGNVDEPFVVEVLVDGMQGRAADLEDRSYAGPPHVEEPGIEPGVQLGRDLLGYIEGERGLGEGDDLEGFGHQFAAAGSLVDCLHGPADPDD